MNLTPSLTPTSFLVMRDDIPALKSLTIYRRAAVDNVDVGGGGGVWGAEVGGGAEGGIAGPRPHLHSQPQPQWASSTTVDEVFRSTFRGCGAGGGDNGDDGGARRRPLLATEWNGEPVDLLLPTLAGISTVESVRLISYLSV